MSECFEYILQNNNNNSNNKKSKNISSVFRPIVVMMIQQAVKNLVQIVVIFGKQFLIEAPIGKSHVN